MSTEVNTIPSLDRHKRKKHSYLVLIQFTSIFYLSTGEIGNLGRHLPRTHDIATGSWEPPTGDKQPAFTQGAVFRCACLIQNVSLPSPLSSLNQSIQLVNTSMNQPTNQPINQSISFFWADGPQGARLLIPPTATLPSYMWSRRIFLSLPGSRLTFFYRDACSALLQLIN